MDTADPESRIFLGAWNIPGYRTPIEDSSIIAENVDASKVDFISVFAVVLGPRKVTVRTSGPILCGRGINGILQIS